MSRTTFLELPRTRFTLPPASSLALSPPVDISRFAANIPDLIAFYEMPPLYPDELPLGESVEFWLVSGYQSNLYAVGASAVATKLLTTNGISTWSPASSGTYISTPGVYGLNLGFPLTDALPGGPYIAALATTTGGTNCEGRMVEFKIGTTR